MNRASTREDHSPCPRRRGQRAEEGFCRLGHQSGERGHRIPRNRVSGNRGDNGQQKRKTASYQALPKRREEPRRDDPPTFTSPEGPLQPDRMAIPRDRPREEGR